MTEDEFQRSGRSRYLNSTVFTSESPASVSMEQGDSSTMDTTNTNTTTKPMMDSAGFAIPAVPVPQDLRSIMEMIGETPVSGAAET
jgi:hypothetical protein